jgi:hypothetical protein
MSQGMEIIYSKLEDEYRTLLRKKESLCELISVFKREIQHLGECQSGITRIGMPKLN